MTSRHSAPTPGLDDGDDGDVPLLLRILAVLIYAAGAFCALVAVCAVCVCLLPVLLGAKAACRLLSAMDRVRRWRP